MTETSYSHFPVSFRLTVDLSKTSATTLVGGTARVDALNIDSGIWTAGAATITSATEIDCVLALNPGNYKIVIGATPSGLSAMKAGETLWTVVQGPTY